MFNIGVISDTHGLLRPQATGFLRGSDAIIHAGDVGDPDILADLEKVAPVTAVRGNIDTAAWSKKLPETNVLKHGGLHIYVLHDVTNPEAYGGLPKNPRIPWVVRLWKGPAKWIGNLAMLVLAATRAP